MNIQVVKLTCCIFLHKMGRIIHVMIRPMNREQKQLVFAIRYYWNLCERLYSRIDPATKYLDESGGDDRTNTLYKMHLASCCFRIASLIESRQQRQSVYRMLNNDSNYQVNASELSILIRDTVSHVEDPQHNKFNLRRSYLCSKALGDIHSAVATLVSSISAGTF